MKLTIILDSNKEEILIYTKEMTPKIEKIKSIVEENYTLVGHKNETIKKIEMSDIVAIFTRDNKVYISLQDGEYLVKHRLYQIEESLDDAFIKINQGCIVNINFIKEFSTSFNASLKVIMKNGFTDYISRRELKNVKRRLSL